MGGGREHERSLFPANFAKRFSHTPAQTNSTDCLREIASNIRYTSDGSRPTQESFVVQEVFHGIRDFTAITKLSDEEKFKILERTHAGSVMRIAMNMIIPIPVEQI